MAGEITRQGFGQEVEVSAETASSAIAAQAQAAVQSRYVMALRAPRDMMQVRSALLKECGRPGFAESSRYAIPRGGKTITGWSIRFAEAAIRNMRNTLVESSVIFEDAEKRLVRVTVTDLETNTTYPTEIMIAKTVERSSVKEGATVLRTRENSSGRKTYIVEATEDELLVKQASLVSKALRTNALRLIPGDILDECEAAVVATMGGKGRGSAERAKKAADAFERLGIPVAQVAEYLGHGLDTATGEELTEMQAVWTAINDGETTWKAVMEGKRGEQAPRKKGDASKVMASIDDAPPHDAVTGEVVATATPVVEPKAKASKEAPKQTLASLKKAVDDAAAKNVEAMDVAMALIDVAVANRDLTANDETKIREYFKGLMEERFA